MDLWQILLKHSLKHQVEWNWVKGHSGHLEQERSDYLANLGLKSKELAIDFAYEQELITQNQQKVESQQQNLINFYCIN